MSDLDDIAGVLERVATYFERSAFDYLALSYRGHALTLLRESAAREQGVTTAVVAAGVGFVEPAPGRESWPAPGDSIAAGDCICVLRRFKTRLEVRAPAAGLFAGAAVEIGAFVEHGQPLATIIGDRPRFSAAH